MAQKKVPFKGAGFGWFPIPKHFVGARDIPGLLFRMTSSPELRLYIALLAESDKAGSYAFTIDNRHLREFANLDRNTLPRARAVLETYAFINRLILGFSTTHNSVGTA